MTRFKDFRTFWTCSFVYPSVKGTDNFWRVGGLIDGFNELLSQIASGVVKMADESISAIRFRINPKGYLQH